MLVMKEYRNAMEKIKASDELKRQTIEKMEAALAKKAEASEPEISRPRFNFSRARVAYVGMAAVFLFCAVFIPVYYALTRSGSDNPGNSALAQEIIDKIKSDAVPYAPEELGGLMDMMNPESDGDIDDVGGLIKAEGDYTYALSLTGLTVTKAGQTKPVKRIIYFNYKPEAMYRSGERLITVGGVFENTRIVVYDVSEPSDIKEIKSCEITGRLLTARINEGGLVLAINYYVGSNSTSYFPKIDSAEIGTDKIRLYEAAAGNYRNYIVTASVNLESLEVVYAAHLGLYGYDTVYATNDSLYVFNIDFSSAAYGELDGFYQQTGIVRTKIYKISLLSLECTAQGVIDGAVINRNCADEYAGNLRVAAFVPFRDFLSDTDKSYVNVYILDGALRESGKIEKIAEGERLQSAQFNKNAGSIATAANLVRLNLSDPANPVVIGTSEIGN